MKMKPKPKKSLLLLDAIINLGLGVLLVFFPEGIVSALGVPSVESAFYPSILGAVLFGIGLALLLERNIGSGLGLYGAVAINLSGGLALGLWLIFGGLQLPPRGEFFLWGLAIVLVGISAVEIMVNKKVGISD
ncbi:hypothetical protein ACFL3Y_01420 [Pseudomonadota bacterium]